MRITFQEKGDVKYVGVGKMIILKWILKWFLRVRIGLNCLKTQSGVGTAGCSNLCLFHDHKSDYQLFSNDGHVVTTAS
jgi:hypothetical protein